MRPNTKQTAAAAAQRARFARVRLLNEEIDRLTADVEQRSSSVANKASFLAVAAGVVIAASAAHLWTAFPVGGVIALGLACIGLLCAAVALRPARRFGLVAQRLADRYLDSNKTALDIEASLVRQKADVISGREADLVGRARWVWNGFGALVLSAIALTIVFALQLLGG